MVEYENQRLMRIEENKRKMKELGIKALAYEAMCLMDQKRQKINKMKSKKVLANDVEYIPDKEGEADQSSEEDDNEEDNNESMQTIRSLGHRSKKVMATRGGNLAKGVEKPQYSTSMSSMVKMRSEARKKQEQQREGKMQQRKVLAPLGQQERSKQNGRVPSQGESQQRVSIAISQQEKEVESNTPIKKGQSKTLVAPGSLGAYVRMKEKSREKQRLSKQIDDYLDEPIQLRNGLSFDQLMENSQKRQASYSGLQLFDGHSGYTLGLVDENEDSESSDDYVFVEEKDADPKEIENDVAEIRNESIPIEDHPNDQPVSRKQKRTRGPSMCKDVHGRTINDRKPIILNDMGQPIGPDKKTLDEFSRFLGSLARDSNLAPLNKLNWHQVSDKDQIWDYVKKKYMIAEEGKGYVLHSVAALWRNYKSRTKKKHYRKYNNKADRWRKRPTSMPDSHFEELLKFWNLKEVQEISEKNMEISESQKDRHTNGPVSFARTRHELEQTEKIPPSEARMYRETRKRKPQRKYKTSYELIEHNINQMEEGQTSQKHRRLSGRCTKRVKGPSKSGMLIPDEFLQPYKAHIVKDIVGEVMKILQQVLPSNMLARIAPSFKDPSNHLVNGQSCSGINDIEQCQDDENGDDEANHDDDLERNDEGIENEVQDHED